MNNTVYATLFMYYPLLEDVKCCIDSIYSNRMLNTHTGKKRKKIYIYIYTSCTRHALQCHSKTPLPLNIA
jgi:hypothetical protein